MEILLAMEVMICALAAVVLMLFGAQDTAADLQAGSEAMARALKMLGEQRALARKDFRLVNSTSTVDGIFRESIEVAIRSYSIKNVKVIVGWKAGGRAQKIELSTLVADYNATAGNDTCDSNLSGDWSQPRKIIFNFAVLTGEAFENYAITDVDAYKGKLYITSNDSSANKETFFVFSINDPENPVLINKIDNDLNNTGLNAVAVGTARNGKTYAYVASASSFTRGQLQIIDVSEDIDPPQIVATFKIDSETVNESGIGNSVYYSEGLVYLGLTKTGSGSSGGEFNIIDARDFPDRPLSLLKSIPIGNNINSIFAKGKYVYLATPNSQELKVFKIEDPAVPVFKEGFDWIGGGNGKSVYAVGDVLYFGRTAPSLGPEFFILDNDDPEKLQINNSVLPRPYAREINSSVNGLIVRDYLAFLLTTKQSANPGQIQILRVDAPQNISIFADAIILPDDGNPLPNYTGSGVAMDCEGNYLYAASIDGSGKNYLSIITGK